MIRINACHSLLHTIAADNPVLPDLQPDIIRLHGHRIRRIDRYIQLCVAGGLGCTEGHKLAADTGVYLATRTGAVETSGRAMTTIERDRELPKPLHFVNTLGNSAGFYLTQLLQLTGNTLVIAKETLSFEAALTHACIDLLAGRGTKALVGGFDEVTLPFAQHLERLDAPADTQTLHEGSHWLLLEARKGDDGPALTLPHFCEDLVSLAEWLKTVPAQTVQLSFTPDQKEIAVLSKRQVTRFGGETFPHGVFSGAALIALLQSGQSGIHIGKDLDGSYCGVCISQ